MNKFKIFVFLLHLFGQQVLAADLRNIDELIQNDREERVIKINELTLELNKSLLALQSIQSDLDRAILSDSHLRPKRVRIRNSSFVISALGFIGTFIYQTKGINPSKFLLGGGYTISALLTVFGLIEQNSINLSREEIQKIRISVVDLEAKINIEKRNLRREIVLLCLADGGTAETCVEP